MKVIIVGASGFCGSQTVKQALMRKDVTEVVAVARKAIAAPAGEGIDASKLKNVVVEGYDPFVVSDDGKKALAGAAGCIWTVAVLPNKARSMDPDQLRRICHDATLEGLRTIHAAQGGAPFRFLYMSGCLSQRDPNKRALIMTDYMHLRGKTENEVLAYAKAHPGLEASVAKPGMIRNPGFGLGAVAGWAINTVLPSVGSSTVTDLAVAMLDQVLNGFESDELMPPALNRIAREAQGREGKALGKTEVKTEVVGK